MMYPARSCCRGGRKRLSMASAGFSASPIHELIKVPDLDHDGQEEKRKGCAKQHRQGISGDRVGPC